MCPTGTAFQNNTKEQQTSNLRSAFEVLDVDGDGKISYDDLRASYDGFSGPDVSDEDVIGSMISMADSNKNGYVEYEEFARVLNRRKGKTGRASDSMMRDAFLVIKACSNSARLLTKSSSNIVLKTRIFFAQV
ncbi:hypothetical protein OROGR_025300 [Orobanche gracilis]